MENKILKLSKRVIDLAIAAGRKRQSPRTGFVHCFPSDEKVVDVIPLYENFCFAMALFRQKSAESVLEAKSIIERLLAFQAEEGNFPIYLHDYPRCWDGWMGLRVAPILTQIVRRFGPVLEAETRDKIVVAIDKILRLAEGMNRPPLWENRFLCLRNEKNTPLIAFHPISAEEWFEVLVNAQLLDEPMFHIPFHSDLNMFIGGVESQDQGEPRPWPIEWVLAEKNGFSNRLLRDHVSMLQAAVLFPAESLFKSIDPYAFSDHGGVRWLWKGGQLHSLTAPKGRWEKGMVIFSLCDQMEKGGRDLIEADFFCNISSETELLIDGKKGTVFHFDNLIQIRTPEMTFGLQFKLLEGTGDFCGQISRGNRPSQTACKGPLLYEAFDWRISMRTLRRFSNCRLGVLVTSSILM